MTQEQAIKRLADAGQDLALAISNVNNMCIDLKAHITIIEEKQLKNDKEIKMLWGYVEKLCELSK